MNDARCTTCNWTGEKREVESVQVSYKRDDPLDKCPECGLIESMLPLDEFEEKFLKVYLSFGGRVEDRPAYHIAYMSFLGGYTERQMEEMAKLKAELEAQ